MTTHEPVSRREFLKLAGTAGAIVGLGAGLGGIVAACKEAEETSDTVATIAIGQTTTSAAQPTTTVSTGPEKGRTIRIGLVSAKTGALALFGKADDWWTDHARAALPQGVPCGDRKIHKFAFVVRDSQSKPDLAAQAAAELITQAKVDIILSSGTAEMVNPVAVQAETLGCPSLSSFVLWQPFVSGRGETAEAPFKWTYAHAVGLEDMTANYLALWGQAETNRKIGFVFPDDPGGRVWADAAIGLPPAVVAEGYESVLPLPYTVGTGDYSAHISEFIKNGCEICCGAMTAADFITFWKQALELKYQPKVVTMGEALLFPQVLEALGSSTGNFTAESLWHPSWPYRDSLTGQSAEQLADDYQRSTGEQWTAPIAQYAKFEWAVDAFKQVRDIDSKEAIIAEVRTTKLNTCLGLIDFTAPIDPTDLNKSKRPAANVYKAPVAGVQWVKGERFPFQPDTITNANNPRLPLAGEVQPMAYETQ